ncbi:MAG: hypothetical protein AAF721_32670 [Myxococcota bacterium]
MKRWVGVSFLGFAACTFGSGSTNSAQVGGTGGDSTSGSADESPLDTAEGVQPDTGSSTSVEPAGTTMGADADVGDTAETSADSTTAADSTSGEPPGPFCGDGNRDPGEDCDDGDRLDYNGCTTQCVVSMTVDWAVTLDSMATASEQLRSVVYHPDTTEYHAVGYRRPQGESDILRIQVDGDGTVTHEETDMVPGTQRDRGIALGPDGQLAIVGIADDFLRVQEVASDWTVNDTLVMAGAAGEFSFGWDIAYGDDGRPTAAGLADASPFDPILVAVNDDWATGDLLTVTTDTSDGFRSIAWSEADSAYFVTYNNFGFATQAELRRFDSELTAMGAIALSGPSNVQLRGVAVNDDGVFAVGFVFEGEPGQYTAHAYGFDLDGTERWHESWTGADGLQAYAIELATDDEGSVIVAGMEFEDIEEVGLVQRPALRKLAADDGSLRWTTVVDVEDHAEGFFNGVTTGPDNRIVAVGGASAPGGINAPLIVALQP